MLGFGDSPKDFAYPEAQLPSFSGFQPGQLAKVEMRSLLVMVIESDKWDNGETLSAMVPFVAVFGLRHNGQIRAMGFGSDRLTREGAPFDGQLPGEFSLCPHGRW